MTSTTGDPSFSAPDRGRALRHEIFIVDAYLNRGLPTEHARDRFTQLVESLMRRHRLESLGPLRFYRSVDEDVPGCSFIQAITTSHISGHYFELPEQRPDFRLDVYSCRSVDWRSVVEIAHSHLDLGNWKGTYLERRLGGVRRALHLAGSGRVVSNRQLLVPVEGAPRSLDAPARPLLR